MEGLGGFGATLTNAQLAALSAEPDLTDYTGGGEQGAGKVTCAAFMPRGTIGATSRERSLMHTPVRPSDVR